MFLNPTSEGAPSIGPVPKNLGDALHSWNFGLAVSYLEGEPEREQLSSQDTKLSEIQLWSALKKGFEFE